MPHPHTISFCIAYASFLGIITMVTLESIRRSRRPGFFFLVGLAALLGTFWIAYGLESGLAHAGQEAYQLGMPYHNFLWVALGVFLLLLFFRGGYSLLKRLRPSSHNPSTNKSYP
jgi:hypothetical protein